MFNVIEKFLSIDGEGPTSGELATFVRFQGCNLRCSWCDTTYSWDKENIYERLNSKDIYNYIKENKAKNVTLTGGEPLVQDNIDELLELLNSDNNLKVHIETNGSVDIEPFKKRYIENNISYIVDFKLPSSHMTEKMNLNNLEVVGLDDVYKFVVGSREDLQMAYDIIRRYDLTSKCLVYLSPVSGNIDMQEIVEFMKDKNLNNVKLQIQLHKIIWDKNARGV
ncbi:putative 7-carboxy-7-deazaguanine synthase QueE [Clostridium chromiireducens]|uniref:7-carboxy-7-deazaguanine synthase n=1 Tax=Clostridium chromiireducens TaxID=225345 RepID=A0A1V4IC14_9CLOT|nr:putative 7-carboxy-7-deazaguanine synthase QueE [Clostridium chromiireducens]MVX65862.1 putative 7-carboxy-7-deazaguanine synthase QueE [Clostridium chromiireducens]OPJ57473.1 7-carboxy-7-deazaguanine synthase [Clostridium chromiireducens]RII34430.1 putative 7-carboxy-7-deazaguanine synthase QueE [Clostridium chromiireducens]